MPVPESRPEAQADVQVDRWMPAVSMWLVSLISYVDRNVLAILAPVILAETHLSAEQYGFIISCFSVTYMIGNPLWGYILDRVGVRKGMTAAVAIWTVASMAHAWASGFWTFGIARAVLGAGEGATFPGGLRAVTYTLSPAKRGRGMALAYSGGSLGAMIAPLIVTPVYQLFGWHGAFLFTGFLGISWIIFWRLTSSSVERAAGGRSFENFASPMPFLDLFRHRTIWALMAAYALGATPLGFILYYSSLYLKARFGFTPQQLGYTLWIPPFGWEVGYFFWGWLLDRIGPRFKGMIFASLLLSLPLVITDSLPTPALVLLELWIAMFALSGYVVVALGYAVRRFPAGHSGLLAGVGAGSWGAMVAITSPIIGSLFDQKNYADAFRFAAVFPVIGYFTWLWITSRTPEPDGGNSYR